MKTLSSLLVLLWLAAVPAVAAATDALNDALRRGLLAEEAQRDLPAAVAAYAEAVRAGDDLRAPMATALFRLAESRRRLGQTNEALGHYRRLLREFPDQTNLVSLARRHVPKAAIRSRGVASIEAELVAMTKALGSLESTEAELAAELERCSAMGADQLHAALSASHPTPELTRLKAERNQAEVRRALLSPDFGPQHPEVLRIAAVQAKLNEQLAKEVEGVMGSLAAQVSALGARVTQERRKVKALESQLLQESLSSDGQSGNTSADPRSEQEQLLLEEIKIAETQEADVRKRREAGRAGQDEVFKAQRDVLALKRQLAALPRLLDVWVAPVKASGDPGGANPTVDPYAEADKLAAELAALDQLNDAKERARFLAARHPLPELESIEQSLRAQPYVEPRTAEQEANSARMREQLELKTQIAIDSLKERLRFARLEADDLSKRQAARMASGKIDLFGSGGLSGTFPVVEGRKLMLSDIIISAGGKSGNEYANLKRVKVRRFDPVSKKETVIEANVTNIIEKGDRNADIELKDGDRVEVPARSIIF